MQSVWSAMERGECGVAIKQIGASQGLRPRLATGHSPPAIVFFGGNAKNTASSTFIAKLAGTLIQLNPRQIK